jgi:uncharacterized delta-60 repeat protein
MATGERHHILSAAGSGPSGLLRLNACAPIVLLLVLALGLFHGSPAQAAGISVSRTFGSRGVAHTSLPHRYEGISFQTLSLEADGGFGAGLYRSGQTRLLHFEADGTLNRSAKPGQVVESPPLEARLADGSRLLVNDNGSTTRIEKLRPDGSPDPGFGTDGAGDPLSFQVTDILPLPSGEVMVVGQGFYSFAGKLIEVDQAELALLGSDGHLDPNFGQAGIVKARSELGIVGGPVAILPGPEGGILLLTALPQEETEASSSSTPRSQVSAIGPAGTIDKSFGESGSVVSPISILSAHELADGSFLIAGNEHGYSITGEAPSRIAVSRYTAAGRPDPSFAAGLGTAQISLGGIDSARVVLWEADGSALIAGANKPDTLPCSIFTICAGTPILVRVTPDGRLDPSFGGDGHVRLTGLAPSSRFEAVGGIEAMIERGDDILVAGGNGIGAFVVGLGPNGVPLAGFGNQGTVMIREPRRSGDLAEAVAVDRRRRILVSGETSAGDAGLSDTGAVIRYLPDGRIDRSFGERGYAALAGRVAHAIAADADGSSFVLTGQGLDDTLEKLTPRGSPDDSWGTEGIIPLEPTSDDEERQFESVAVLPGGQTLVAGVDRPREGNASVIVMRFTAQGRPDPDFGQDGVATYEFGRGLSWYPRHVLSQKGGGIFLAGFASTQPEPRPYARGPKTVALMKIRPGGAVDTGFGHGGTVLTPLPGSSEGADLITQGGGILVAGTTRRGRTVGDLLLRYRNDGKLDRRFARGGVAYRRIGVPTTSGPNVESSALFSLGRHLVEVRAGFGEPVSVYSKNGRREPTTSVGNLVPGRLLQRALPAGPLAATQGRGLVLVWTGRQKPERRYPQAPATIDLCRISIR